MRGPRAVGSMFGMPSLTPEAFAKRWSGSELSERSSYQQHFLDLCEMLGAPKPMEEDPKGESYTFEKGVEKTGGGKGFADVWFRGHFAIEYKDTHEDLSAAYGWPADISDEEILKNLLALNLERSGSSALA